MHPGHKVPAFQSSGAIAPPLRPQSLADWEAGSPAGRGGGGAQQQRRAPLPLQQQQQQQRAPMAAAAHSQPILSPVPMLPTSSSRGFLLPSSASIVPAMGLVPTGPFQPELHREAPATTLSMPPAHSHVPPMMRQHSDAPANPSLEPQARRLYPPGTAAFSRLLHGPCMVNALYQHAVESEEEEEDLPPYPPYPPPSWALGGGMREGAPPHLMPGRNPPPSSYYAQSRNVHYSPPAHYLQSTPTSVPMPLQQQSLPPPHSDFGASSVPGRQQLLGLDSAASMMVFYHDAAAEAAAGGNLAAAAGGGASHSRLRAASHHPGIALPSHNAVTVQQQLPQQRGSYYVPSPTQMHLAPLPLAMGIPVCSSHSAMLPVMGYPVEMEGHYPLHRQAMLGMQPPPQVRMQQPPPAMHFPLFTDGQHLDGRPASRAASWPTAAGGGGGTPSASFHSGTGALRAASQMAAGGLMLQQHSEGNHVLQQQGELLQQAGAGSWVNAPLAPAGRARRFSAEADPDLFCSEAANFLRSLIEEDCQLHEEAAAAAFMMQRANAVPPPPPASPNGDRNSSQLQ